MAIKLDKNESFSDSHKDEHHWDLGNGNRYKPKKKLKINNKTPEILKIELITWVFLIYFLFKKLIITQKDISGFLDVHALLVNFQLFIGTI